MDRTAIREYFQRHKDAAEISRALHVLDEVSLVRKESQADTGGRPREVWFART